MDQDYKYYLESRDREGKPSKYADTNNPMIVYQSTLFPFPQFYT